jgi:hypothetical protein
MLERDAKSESTHLADPTENADITEPSEHSDSADATEPIDSTEPTEAIDSTEPFDPIESNEFSEHKDHRELPMRARPGSLAFRCTLSAGEYRSSRLSVCPSRTCRAVVASRARRRLEAALARRLAPSHAERCTDSGPKAGRHTAR